MEFQKNFLIPDVGIDYKGYGATRRILRLLARLNILQAVQRESTTDQFVGFVVKIGSPNGTRTRFP